MTTQTVGRYLEARITNRAEYHSMRTHVASREWRRLWDHSLTDEIKADIDAKLKTLRKEGGA